MNPPAPQPHPRILKRKIPQTAEVISHIHVQEVRLPSPPKPEPQNKITFNQTKYNNLPSVELDLNDSYIAPAPKKVRAYPNSGVNRMELIEIQMYNYEDFRSGLGL
ncbi:hypothetical protein SS50377_22670 [Spironucleus salmonicida]|uniref:Uncharacterized protein n=1 Tax=Spironucleus salmonicida TaxID=348837 RepID=V6LWN1_9EUKA|nr:hypothetical protein SS50377_22670 [Spironucleus salmonicida]|eukprot:EST48990.1 Hypothetical protein SS50377_10760 [Spironucleus salmonicida]